MTTRNEFYTIYGEIESIVCKHMAEEGKLTILPEKAGLPEGHQLNEAGMAARFAIFIPRKNIAEMERRIQNLRI